MQPWLVLYLPEGIFLEQWCSREFASIVESRLYFASLRRFFVRLYHTQEYQEYIIYTWYAAWSQSRKVWMNEPTLRYGASETISIVSMRLLQPVDLHRPTFRRWMKCMSAKGRKDNLLLGDALHIFESVFTVQKRMVESNKRSLPTWSLPRLPSYRTSAQCQTIHSNMDQWEASGRLRAKKISSLDPCIELTGPPLICKLCGIYLTKAIGLEVSNRIE